MAYKIKQHKECEMPDTDGPLKVLVLNASLKHHKDISNTEEVAQQVLGNMAKFSEVETEIIRLADKNIPVGLGF